MENKRNFERGTTAKLTHYQHCPGLLQWFKKMHVILK